MNNNQVMSNNNFAYHLSNEVIEQILIPATKTGLLIGTGGSNIDQLKTRFHVFMRLLQFDGDDRTSDKFLTIKGRSDNVKEALEHIRKNYIDRDIPHREGLPKDTNGNILVTRNLKIPKDRVGVVIGTNGRTIKDIQTRSGVGRITIHGADPDSLGEPYAFIKGTIGQVEKAAKMINDRIHPFIKRPVSIFIEVSKEMALHFMPPNAPNLVMIQEISQAMVRLHSVDVATQMHTFEIHGLQFQVNQAQRLFVQCQNDLMRAKMNPFSQSMGFPIIMPAPPVNCMNPVIVHSSCNFSASGTAGTTASGYPDGIYQPNCEATNPTFNPCVQFQSYHRQPIYDSQGSGVFAPYVPYQFQSMGVSMPYATTVPSVPVLQGNNQLQPPSQQVCMNQSTPNSHPTWTYYAQQEPTRPTTVNQPVVEVLNAEECHETQQQTAVIGQNGDASGCQLMYTMSQQPAYYAANPPMPQALS